MSEQTTDTENKTSTKSQWRERECGAAWGTSEKGRISFHILNKAGEKIHFVMFPNKFKEASNQPDWRVYKDVRDSLPATKKVDSKPSPKVEEQIKSPAPEQNQEEFV